MSTAIPQLPELTDAICAYNRSVATNFMYILPQIMCSLSGIASVTVLTYSFFLYGFRLLFHYNAKVLMILLTIFCLLFSLDVTYICTRQILNALTFKNDCDLVMLTSECSFLRRIALTCFVGVTTTQFSQMLERLVATCLKEKYEFQTQWLGGLFVLFSVLSAILTVEWILWNENPLEPMTHCLTYSASISIGGRMYSVFYGILAVDIFILVIFIGLYSNNRRKVLSAGLNKKYQQHENLIVLRALFPMVALNTIFVSSYILIVVIVRRFKDTMSLTNYKLFSINTFIFPYVSLLLSITILVTTKSEFKRRLLRKQETSQNGNTQTYFTMYNSQWNNVSRDKKYYKGLR